MPRNNEWIEQVHEDALEPGLPICDPHHHLWDFREGTPEPRYLLDNLLEDTNSGHNIVSTVFIECHAMYRADGPEEMKPVGEVEFVNGIAAMSASGLYGKTKVAAGIIGHADLTRGAAAGKVLDALTAHGGGRFRGIRHAVAWEADPAISNHRTNPPEHRYMDPKFREGLAARTAQADLRGLVLHEADRRADRSGEERAGRDDHPQPLRWSSGHRGLCQQEGRGDGILARRDRQAGRMPERGRQARRAQHARQRLQLARAAEAADQPGTDRRDEAFLRIHHRESSAWTAACSKATSRSTS